MTGIEAFIFFLGGLVVGLFGPDILGAAATLFEPPFEKERDRWGGE